MDPQNWRRVEELFHAAAEQPSERRSEFLAAACKGDDSLLRQVQELLADDTASRRLLDSPLWGQISESSPMRLPSGTMLGPYRILEHLGAGGMGSVYLAEDTRLKRRVAIKFLRFESSASLELRQRFEREARAISALNHPHICALYDVGRHDGADYLVMEFVQGQTLGARLRKGPLAVQEALAIAARIASALAAAHAKSIVHRDLKPENIMLTTDGPKILDFGLAKTAPIAPTPYDSTLTASPPLTVEGAVMGTLPYMAPEQLEGRECDTRTDIFAFGLVLYEMLTGRRAFPQQSGPGLIAAIMGGEPDSALLPSDGRVRQVLYGCIEKDPARRWQSIADIKRLLEASDTVAAPLSARRSRLAWYLATAGIAAAAVLATLYWRPAVRPQPVKFALDLGADPVISPDGVQVAYVAQRGATAPSIWIHRLDDASDTRLAGTELAQSLFWSDDGQWIGFFSDRQLRRIHPPDGLPQKIIEIPFAIFAAWTPGGDILFARSQRSPLFRIPASGGTAQPLTKLDESRTENSHRWTQVLPDGRHFLYLARCTDRQNNALYLGSLDSGKVVRIAEMQSNAQYLPASGGHPASLLYVRDGAMVAQQFDGSRLIGQPVTVVEGVNYLPASARADFVVSRDARTLLYSAARGDVSLDWFDRTGRRLSQAAPAAEYQSPRISPDETRVAFSRPDSHTGNRDIWSVDLRSSTLSRLTTSPANDWIPVWSPDSKQILFISDRLGGTFNRVFLKTALEPGMREEAFSPAPAGDTNSDDWSSTGLITLNILGADHLRQIWIVERSSGKYFRFLPEDYNASHARFSPDGKWIAYVSDETGRSEVYVRPFHGVPADNEGRVQASRGGGDYVVWSRSGDELFFIAPDLTLKAFDLRKKDPSPESLFRVCPGTGLQGPPGNATPWMHPFDVTRDGRFLFACLTDPPGQYLAWMNWR